ncbi:MAG: DUF1127 domain-containing protein [Hyphomicrobiales bacterium]
MTMTPRLPIETTISATAPIAARHMTNGVAYLAKRMAIFWNTWKNRRMMTKLVTLDDHMLKDIGLTRGDLRMVSALPYSDDPTSRLRVLAVERRASERAWAREVHYRRSARAQELAETVTEQYRSSDNQDTANR